MGAPLHESFAILDHSYDFAPPLTCFLQVTITNEGGKLVATAVPGGGSGDFANLKKVDGFLELPLQKSEFLAGEVFPYIGFRQ
mgnify:FL=1